MKQTINWKLLKNCKDLYSSIPDPKVSQEEDFRSNLKFIEMFMVHENPHFFEEEFEYKVSVKRDHANVKEEESPAENDGKPMRFKFSRVKSDFEQYSIASLFEPILSQINSHLDNLAKAE